MVEQKTSKRNKFFLHILRISSGIRVPSLPLQMYHMGYIQSLQKLQKQCNLVLRKKKETTMCQNTFARGTFHTDKRQAKDKTDISAEQTFKDFGPTDLC